MRSCGGEHPQLAAVVLALPAPSAATYPAHARTAHGSTRRRSPRRALASLACMAASTCGSPVSGIQLMAWAGGRRCEGMTSPLKPSTNCKGRARQGNSGCVATQWALCKQRQLRRWEGRKQSAAVSRAGRCCKYTMLLQPAASTIRSSTPPPGSARPDRTAAAMRAVHERQRQRMWGKSPDAHNPPAACLAPKRTWLRLPSGLGSGSSKEKAPSGSSCMATGSRRRRGPS